MNAGTLTLGPIVLRHFEIPALIEFGGSQRLAVHRLSTGVRTTEVLGPDDADIVFSGILSGPSASTRSRELNTLRRLGKVLQLSWNRYTYLVVIREFRANYANDWWIPYRISCSVVDDAGAGFPEYMLSAGANAVASIEQLQAILPQSTLPLANVAQVLRSPGVSANSGQAVAAAREVLASLQATLEVTTREAEADITVTPLNGPLAPVQFQPLFGTITASAFDLQYAHIANAYIGQAMLYLTKG